MKKNVKRPAAGGAAAAGQPAPGTALYVVGAALLLAGQVQLMRSQFGNGLFFSALGVAAIFFNLLRPLLPALDIRGLVTALVSEAKAMLSRQGATKAGVSARPKQAFAQSWDSWRLFDSDSLVLSRNWLLAPLGLCAVLVQLALVGGHVVPACLSIVMLALLGAVYSQDRSQPIVLPFINDNAKTLLWVALGLPFQLLGAKLLWDYHYEFCGWGLTTLGSLVMLSALFLRPLKLMDRPEDCSNDLRWSPPKNWWSSELWSVKSALIGGAAICAYLAMFVFYPGSMGLSVAFAFAGMILLLGSFPWLPEGLAGSSLLPQPGRALLSLGMAGFAFILGVSGQAAIDQGRLRPGLWQFLFGGILLVLALQHLPGASGEQEASPEEGEKDAAALPAKKNMRKFEIVGMLIFFLLAFQFRAWNQNLFPYGAEGDEAGGGIFAINALQGHVENPMVTENVPLFFYSVTSLFFKLFGLSVGVMRLHAAVFGTLSLVALYFLLRLFFGRLTGFLATMLMAFAYWHLHYSRFGHYNVEQLFYQTAAFYYVFKGMRTERTLYFALGGICFGFAMLPALASRVLPFAAIALLLYYLVARRDLLRRHLSGFLVFIVCAWMLASPCLVYWLRVTSLSMGRAASVSIFDKTNSNAPVDALAGFVTNCKIDMLMFNEMGDSRSRDNPLPPQKMLERWTAVLFALAFLYTLYYWRNSFNFFLLALFFINLCTSIFSVEAPQSHRTAGNIPVVFSMIAVLLWDLRKAFDGLGRKRGLLLFSAIMVPAFLFFSYESAYKYFVEASHLAYDVAPTYIAQMAGENGTSKDQALFWATGFASGHPPVQLFKRDVPMGNYAVIADYFPISLASDRNHHIFLADVYQDFVPYVRSLYPDAKYVRMPDHLGGRDIATYIYISKENIASLTGMTATVEGASGIPKLVSATALVFPQAGLEGARRIHWKGTVREMYFGLYTWTASGRGNCRISVNGHLAFSRSAGLESKPVQLRMPRGLSRMEVDFSPASAQDSFTISYVGAPHPAHLLYSLLQTVHGPLDKAQSFHVEAEGLYGKYYANRNWSGDAVMEYLEPSILENWLDSPFAGNWSADWKGWLRIDQPGDYSMHLNGLGNFSDVRVDGTLISRIGAAPWAEMSPPKFKPQIHLERGRHSIEVRYSTAGASWIDLRWTPPGGSEELLPPSALTPLYP